MDGMNYKFSELFEQLNVKAELKAAFSDVTVERMVMNQKKGVLKIYIHHNAMIPKDLIFALEAALDREIGKLIQSSENVQVKIIEKYTLPDVYTLDMLLLDYHESILLELGKRNHFLQSLYSRAIVGVEDEFLVVSIDDSSIARSFEEKFVTILTKIFVERFNLTLRVKIDYIPVPEVPFEPWHYDECSLDEEIARHSGNIDAASTAQSTENGIENGIEKTAEADSKDGNNTASLSEETKKEKQPESTVKADKPQKDFTKPSKSSSSYSGSYKQNSKYKKEDRKDYGDSLVRSDNPDVLYLKDFEGDFVAIEDVPDDNLNEVVIRGEVISVEDRFFEKSGKTMIKVEISDYTDSMKMKVWLKEELAKQFMDAIKPGNFIAACGIAQLDTFDHELQLTSVRGIKKTGPIREKRVDTSEAKRVELHLHTKMSDSDAVTDVDSYLKQAVNFGHTAMAITDHGNVQSFPEAFHYQKDGKLPKDFKIIYGVEAYLVDDMQKIVTGEESCSLNGDFVVFDIETTGFSTELNRIIEIGAVKVSGGVIVDRFSEFVNPRVPIPFRITSLTSITDDMVKDAPGIEEILPKFLAFSEGSIFVAHNASFDMSFIMKNARDLGIQRTYTYIDTVALSRKMLPNIKNYKLDTVAKELRVVLDHHHRAVDDAECTAQIFVKLLPQLKEAGVEEVSALNEYGVLDDEGIRKLNYFHAIILAKNEVGRRNLNSLVSASNLRFFSRRPKIPKSMIMQYREGLILGSACERGELYEAIKDSRDQARIAEIVEFYDYLEIQPLSNNFFQIASPRYESIESVDDLKNINKKIVELGKIFHKPVCATTDAHFLNPEDVIYRQIILAAQGMQDGDTPLYFRTTDEMLKEFDYLGAEKAFEVVVTNTNLIADMCDYISPVRPDKCPPVIENSDQLLRTICYNKAHEMYGDPMPEIVKKRLDRELDSIIGNGFAVMYIIAQKLVWKSVEDGYLVGSRGSVGSSFVATMSGITEVNPLPPHYYCLECHYNDFTSEEVRQYAMDGLAGCDLPPKICPNCGKPLSKDGFDIPFETFLGFKGDKEPDIDLNFSGEYQSKAHKYTEVIFGAGQTFRAGTIGTLADKTAYGYVKNFFRDHNLNKREGEVNRLVQGCVGVRRTTGQHPGGIVVLPVGEDINSFTAVQHPANDMTTDIITTHLDYHSIDHNLLKLDILGHDDPTMIRMLQDLTGLDPVTIPLDDPGVMSLFQSTEALGITPDQIGGTKLGCLGIPEFGTPFAMGMLIKTQPTHFTDLVRIAGLSHGTDVWLGNAETLIDEGKATITTCISTRDDIMTYLINKGLEEGKAFTIMERVRKGTVAKGKCKEWPEFKADMLAHDVPDWYVWSCEKIKYMFPKAHAAAYVMMGWRIAYWKINYPLAYYAAFFTSRAKAFSYGDMCLGPAKVDKWIAEFKQRLKKEKGGKADDLEVDFDESSDASEGESGKSKGGDGKITPKEEGMYRDMQIVREMYARGYDFCKIDLYKAKAKDFQIVDGKIMPSFTSIEGMGEKAAEQLEIAAKDGVFKSIEDIKNRAKVSQSVLDTMAECGILDGFSKTNQLTIFDMI